MKRRRLRNRRSGRRPEIAVSQILAWADIFHERVGRWPHKVDGRIAGGLGLTWLAVDKALGLEFDLTARGMGVRSQRYSMLVDDGVVKAFNLEAPGKFEVSGAETLLEQTGKLGG